MKNRTEGSGGSLEDIGAPESWEAVDLEESMKRLMLCSTSSASELDFDDPVSGSADLAPSSSGGVSDKLASSSEEAVSQVDQFLREALQNPRERLSVLRMEQDVEKFIRDPTQQQMEFQLLPTSYLRLAAHRVAQHYFLHSVVLPDKNLPEGSGSRILVCKTSSECRFPHIRLADIPVNLPQEESSVVKLAIKQRPQKHPHSANNNNSSSAKINQSKSVEERKEEYNRARARIFSSGAPASISSEKPENETRWSDSFSASVGIPRFEEKSVSGGADVSIGRSVIDSASGSSRSARSRTEKEPVGRYKPSHRVAIFRDREVESKDPDYDRSYGRYMRRFDPGFGFNTGAYTIQPMYTPAINYNTEFPQLGSSHQPQDSAEHRPHPVAQNLPGTCASVSNNTGIGYGHPETLMNAYTPSHSSASSTSAIYMQSSQYPGQHPGMPFIHSHEHIHQPFAQSLQQQHDATLGLARPR